MKETRPSWYDKAKDGPFANKGFTANHKQAVMMKVQESKASAARSGFRDGKRKRTYWGYTAAAILAIVAAGWLWNSEILNSNPIHQAQDILTETPPAGVTHAVWNTAKSAMNEVVGKEMEFERSEKLDNNQMFMAFRGEGDDLANIWIDTALNEVTGVISTASLSNEAAASYGEKAEAELKRLGYNGTFDYSARRHVLYKMDNETQDTALISLKSEDAIVEFSNGEMERVWLPIPIDEVPAEVEEAASAALKKLSGTKEIAPLSFSYQTHYIRPGYDVLELHYGEEAVVYYELNQKEIIQVSDWSLNGVDESSTQIKDSDTVKQTIAPLINDLLGIDITSYQVTVDEKKPGSYLFEKKGEPSIEAAYNTNQYIYSITKHIDVAGSK